MLIVSKYLESRKLATSYFLASLNGVSNIEILI